MKYGSRKRMKSRNGGHRHILSMSISLMNERIKRQITFHYREKKSVLDKIDIVILTIANILHFID